MRLTRIQRYLLSILSGILMVLSFPYTGSLTFLAFIAWVPLLLVEDTISLQRYKSGKVLIHAYITFLIYNVGTTWWIWNADSDGAKMAFILNALLMTVAFQLFHFIKKRLGNKIGYFSFIVVWIGFEFLHYNWELSWPWLTLGNIFSITPSWIQWYEFTGVLGGSLWLLIVNFLLFRLIQNPISTSSEKRFSPKKIAIPVVVILFPLSLSFWMYYTHQDEGISKEIVIIQPNIDPYEKFSTIGPEQQLQRICDLAEQTITNRTQFVIAPETAIVRPFDEAVVDYALGYEILRDRMMNWGETNLFLGASTEKRFDKKNSRASKKDPFGGTGYIEYYNSSLIMSPTITPEIIHKSKLVLGAEKVPFSHWLPFLEELSIDFGGTSGTLGVEPEPRNSIKGAFSFTPSICYESVYGEFTAYQTRLGSKAIFIITNDGWWDDTPGYKQHFSFARLRAIENRKSVARSANTGTSGFINQRGDVLKASKWWTIDVLKGNVLLNDKKTVYMRTGDILGRLAFVSAAIILLYSLFKNRLASSRKQV
jgi:apolipoprotein N-acyltransferase